METLSIPDEYSHIFAEIADSELESYQHSFQTADNELHLYERIGESLEKTLQVYTNPSPYWYLLYSRISFVSTKYDSLEKYYNQVEQSKKYIVAPFLGRIKAFQNKYEEAIELANLSLDHINTEEPTLLDVIIFFEANFTLGLSFAYTRKFDQADQIISQLEEASQKYLYKKLIGEAHILDYVFIENIIKGYSMFFAGKPKEMSEVLLSIREWIPNLKDPWLEGFYFNIYGISRIMFQELSEGDRALRVAFKKFEQVHDLRGYSTVGANLGVSLISKGRRMEGRKYIEAVIEPMITMKNYWLAVGNMLELVKSYVEEKMIDKAQKFLHHAEEIALEHDIGDPNTYSMFCFFYSRVGELNKSKDFLEKLSKIREESEEEDQYANLFYYMASAITTMHHGNLDKANQDIVKGIEIADKSEYFNYALELSMLHLEIILKRYLVEQKQTYILKALEVIIDLTPLISMTDSPFYETLFYLLTAYLFLAVQNYSEANENFDRAQEIALDREETAQFKELTLYEERRNFMTQRGSSEKSSSMMLDEFVNQWLSDEYLPIFYVMEAKRLLLNLQFEKTSLDRKTEDLSQPKLLFIVGNGGITIYSHRFDDDESLDEVLVGGFLSALTTFSQELFGGGMLTRIDQENHVLLMEKISSEHILVMIVDKETYSLRKNFKRFSNELSKMKVIEYLNTDQILSEFDPQYQVIEGIVEIVFGEDSTHDDDSETGAEYSQEQADVGKGDDKQVEDSHTDEPNDLMEEAGEGEEPDDSDKSSFPESDGFDEDPLTKPDHTPPGVEVEDVALTEEEPQSNQESLPDPIMVESEVSRSVSDPIQQDENEPNSSDDEDDGYIPSFKQYDSEND